MEQARLVLPKRPKRSQNLQKMEGIQLVTNLYPLSLTGNTHMHTYALEFDPPIEKNARSLSDKIYRSAIDQIREVFGQKVFKRGWNFWSNVKAKEKITFFSTKYEEKEYQLQFSWVNEVDLQDMDTIEGTGNSVTQILNVQVKKMMYSMGLIEIGRNSKYYDPKELNSFPVKNQDLNVWRGYKTSVVLCPKSSYLLVDFSSRVLRQETALGFLDDPRFKSDQEAADAMVGLSCMAYYGNHRIYRIDQMMFEMTPMSKFMQTKTGKEITFSQYFKEVYNITIRDTKQPLIRHFDKRTGKELYLIPELMKMTGLTDQQRNDGRLMQAVAEHTKLNPQERIRYIEEHVRKMASQLEKEGLHIRTDNNKQNGFVLNAPQLRLGGGKLLEPQSGGFDLKQNPVFKPVRLKDWVLIYQGRSQQDDEQADNFVYDMKKASAAFGLKVEDPAFIPINSNRANDWVNELDKDFQKNGNPDFVVSLITARDKNTIYPALKKYLYKEKGVPHQNAVLNSLNKNRMSVISKILLQINAKLSQPLWLVPRPEQVDDKTMIIGIDVYKKLVAGKKSCIGFVSSVDPQFSQYFSKIYLQDPKDDILTHLTTLIHQAVKEFFNYNGEKFFPETIVIYRDGVGEGQLSSVVDIEIKAILEGLKKVSPKYNPQLAYILINKQINHRYFVEENVKRGQGRGGKGAPRPGLVNPPSGTILAESVTSSRFDFFLASQNVRQGTCTPTHYTVGYNSTDWNEETFWMLTYYQCFNYYNWSGAVKVPAPVQYAHKLSYLVGDTFQSNPHESLKDCLYYL